MSKEIIINIGVLDTRVALTEDGNLVEFFIERNNPQCTAGNIYRGRVSSVLPGIQAAFVDIGTDRNAFLYIDDINNSVIDEDEEFDADYEHYEGSVGGSGHCFNGKSYPIEDMLKQGQEITVQVAKEPIGSKGSRLTTNITLPGRYLVLMPNADYTGISRKIEDEKERLFLKKLLGVIKPGGIGLIARTAAEGRTPVEIEQDLQFLLRLWDNIKHKERSVTAPRCLHKDFNLVYRTVRDMFNADIDRLIVNNSQQYEKILELVGMMSPDLKDRVEFVAESVDIFSRYDINTKVMRALARKVWLKSGGYIVIDKTEALTVIDVNTGKYTGKNNFEDTVYRTNLEAAGEIARQLRLRDIGGIIIIDFIDMKAAEHRNGILSELRKELKKDRTKTVVLGITGLGLIEMTRKKVREELYSVLTEDCPRCGGAGRVLREETTC